uniref:Pentatricopeptide repeat-containing protein At3g12770 n=1 Tax=Anthurium amnicola TaxID=1678845 RepID=A0A1D1ZJR8_9ARAE
MNLSSSAATPAARYAAALGPLRPRPLPFLSDSDDPVGLSAAAPDDDPDAHYGSLIDSSPDPSRLRRVHARLVTAGLHGRRFLATKLVHACSRLGQTRHGRQVFDHVPDPNIFLWNAAIKLHSAHGQFSHALDLYNRMLQAWVRPDGFTLPSVLRSCSGASALDMARAVHAQVLRYGFGSDVFLQNGLVAVYAKCREMGRAGMVFDGLPDRDRDIISWTSVISGCAQNGRPLEALEVFSQMRSSDYGVRPDFVVLVSLLKAYTDINDLEQGKSVHGYTIKCGLETEEDLLIALTALYAKCGKVCEARTLFDCVPSPTLILWNAMISGYAKNGYAKEAVELFRWMTDSPLTPDSITIRSAILACAQLGSLEMARWMEDYAYNSEFKDDVLVNTALIDMYAKCGSINHAHMLFDRIHSKDVVVWSAIIGGYGFHGYGYEAIGLFNEMECSGVRPNEITFIGLLSACNHAGLVDEGWRYFHSMREHGIEPRHQHYACVVDLLARAGYLEDAFKFVMTMPVEPTVTIWGALLNACKIYGRVELGAYAAERIFSLDPSNVGHYVQLSNLYASACMWSDVAKVRVLMKERILTKSIGSSLIEINGRLQAFHVGDKSHPKSKEIFSVIHGLEMKLKEAGFVPHVQLVLSELYI